MSKRSRICAYCGTVRFDDLLRLDFKTSAFNHSAIPPLARCCGSDFAIPDGDKHPRRPDDEIGFYKKTTVGNHIQCAGSRHCFCSGLLIMLPYENQTAFRGRIMPSRNDSRTLPPVPIREAKPWDFYSIVLMVKALTGFENSLKPGAGSG